jgi:carboxylesterase
VVRRRRGISFIDPTIVPRDKNLSLIPRSQHLVSHVTTRATDEEARRWYSNRPAQTLTQMNDLITRLRTQLARGFQLPAGAQAKVYKTTRDETADPVSALLIHRGPRTSEGRHVEVQMLDSRLHVFTRLAAATRA